MDPNSNPTGITKGPDNALWFTSPYYNNQVGRMTADGHVIWFSGGDRAEVITTGPDGNLWLAAAGYKEISRLHIDGTIQTFAIPDGPEGIGGITSGPDGNIWYGRAYFTFRVGRVPTDPDAPPPPPPPPPPLPVGGAIGAVGIAALGRRRRPRVIPA